ncbi:unnamed protein product [Acanthosepion pharaonis]|uniref:Uncharacterized protein n=1 Tax=Acanthosepion pharaonis TaxID=158019 RepID=A0A812CDK2_ACAPH|nr:unnamed protein product [Sepia pharaonis]
MMNFCLFNFFNDVKRHPLLSSARSDCGVAVVCVRGKFEICCSNDFVVGVTTVIGSPSATRTIGSLNLGSSSSSRVTIPRVNSLSAAARASLASPLFSSCSASHVVRYGFLIFGVTRRYWRVGRQAEQLHSTQRLTLDDMTVSFRHCLGSFILWCHFSFLPFQSETKKDVIFRSRFYHHFLPISLPISSRWISFLFLSLSSNLHIFFCRYSRYLFLSRSSRTTEFYLQF